MLEVVVYMLAIVKKFECCVLCAALQPPLMGVLDLSPMLAFLVLGILTSILNTSVA